jgi:hypothetical protein
MTLRPRDRVALIGLLCLALVAAYYLLALAPERAKVKALDGAIAAQQQALAQAQQQLVAGRAAQAALGADAAEWTSINLAVPTQADIPALLRTLERTANAEHVKMQAINLTASSSATAQSSTSASSAAASSTAIATPIQLTFAGGYLPLEGLIQRIDSFVVVSGGRVHATGPLVSIGSVQMSGTKNLVAQFTATIYELSASSTASGATTTGGLQ